jgi:radical SAM superfamily enzyme YgiQ (UPF0313 family)
LAGAARLNRQDVVTGDRMQVKFILPALVEAAAPGFSAKQGLRRPIKYSLFPPLGLAQLGAFLGPGDDARIVDEHVEELSLDDRPDLVGIEVYVTNARRAYRIADAYRARGVRVILGGLHVTALPDEAAAHADTIFIGPAEQTFPEFLRDLAGGAPKARYASSRGRTLSEVPLPRRDLIRRELYLVPNSLVVSRGCPHHCTFCYKDAFFEGGRSFYTRRVDAALAEIESLPGRHLYFLDDHLLGDARFARGLFSGMRGMRRLFQGAATIDSILRGDLIERAAEAGLRSLFVGFETLTPRALKEARKLQNLGQDYDRAVRRLDDLGVLVNGSFVFGLDGDGPDVFDRTLDFARSRGITTATFHIATPYPGTALYERMRREGRMLHHDYDLYDTRHVVFSPHGMTPEQLEAGYHRAYREFYSFPSIVEASLAHSSLSRSLKHFAYATGWKRFEALWDLAIRAQSMQRARPLLEAVLATVRPRRSEGVVEKTDAAPSARLRVFDGSDPVGSLLEGLESA